MKLSTRRATDEAQIIAYQGVWKPPLLSLLIQDIEN